jgi:hypothetical protein
MIRNGIQTIISLSCVSFLCFSIPSCNKKNAATGHAEKSDVQNIKKDSLPTETRLPNSIPISNWFTNDSFLVNRIYRDHIYKTGTIVYRAATNDDESEFIKAGDSVLSKVIIRDTVIDNDTVIEMVLLASKRPNNDCHVCAPNIDGYLIKVSNEGRIFEEIITRNITTLGSYNEAPEKIDLMEIGDHHFGFMLESGYTAQGYNTVGITLIALVGGTFRDIFSCVIETDNLGNDDNGYESNSTYEFITAEGSEFYSIQVHTSGTELKNNVIVPVDRLAVYEFIDSAYICVNCSNED